LSGKEVDNILTSTDKIETDRKKYPEVLTKFDSQFKVRKTSFLSEVTSTEAIKKKVKQ